MGRSFPYDADKEDTSDILSSTTEFHFISFHFKCKTPCRKGFFGHEIFLVDLNQVFFSVFPFLNGKCIKRKRNK